MESTDLCHHQFENWWNRLSEPAQVDIAAIVGLLEQLGPDLKFPHSSGIQGSKNSRLRELRIQHRGDPTGYSMHSIRDVVQSYWLGAIKGEVSDGMRSTYLWRNGFTIPM